jgi:outer membrane protein TolC
MEGIASIQTYLTMVRARKASGQGLESDLLKTQVRLDEEDALLTAAQRNLVEARMELNVLMGRTPEESLDLVPLEEPHSPPEIPDANPSKLPDIVAVLANRDAALAEVSVTKGAFLPHINLFANTGLVDPGFGLLQPNPALNHRVRGDYGAAIGLDISWDIWDSGTYRAKINEARQTAEKTAASIVVTQRQVGVEYARAKADLELWFREFQTRSHQLPLARSSYVAAESLYRGGRGTALNVLDAFDSLINVQLNRAQALFQLRLAHARLMRRSGS